jgi:tripartite-type tricarboxylate transporter receptor subunit TctC
MKQDIFLGVGSRLWLGVAAFLMLVFGPRALAAQQAVFPSGPIKLVVGYAAGGSVDLVARRLAPVLSRRLGQPVSVENLAGASGSIAAVNVALAAPDGHTLLLGSPAEIGINHLLDRRGRFDPLKDLTPIGAVGSQPLVLVASGASSVRDLGGFLEYATTHRRQARYGTAGHGTPLHLAGETIKRLSGAPMEHVPYRGAGLLLPDLLSGRTEFAVMVLSSAMPHVRDGKLRVLGLTQASASAAAKDLPVLGAHPCGSACSGRPGCRRPSPSACAWSCGRRCSSRSCARRWKPTGCH